MRSTALFILLATLLTDPIAGQTAAEQKVRQVLDEQVSAWNRGDIPGYMAGYWRSDSTVFVSGGTRTTGYDSVLARYQRGYTNREKMGVLTFEELEIREVTPTLALATGIWRLKRKSDAPWGRFTLWVEKKPEGWRVTYDHTSSANN